MRLPGSEKLEIIRLVEQSHLPARRTLEMLGHPSHRRSIAGTIGIEPADLRRSKTSRRGRIASGTAFPTLSAQRIVAMALEVPELSPRELATRFTDTRRLFRLGIFRLSAAQGPRPDHQPGLRRDQGGRRVQGQDNSAQPALADRLHLPQGHRLGLVLSVDHPR